MRISRYQLQALIRYYESKEKKKHVLAGLIRTDLGDLDLAKIEEAVRKGTLEIGV